MRDMVWSIFWFRGSGLGIWVLEGVGMQVLRLKGFRDLGFRV